MWDLWEKSEWILLFLNKYISYNMRGFFLQLPDDKVLLLVKYLNIIANIILSADNLYLCGVLVMNIKYFNKRD